MHNALVPLLLYADDLILMFESAAELQKQLDALASFCEQHQFPLNLSKTKVVVFEARRSNVPDFVLDSTLVKRVDSYKYLGFVFHQGHESWDSFLGHQLPPWQLPERHCLPCGSSVYLWGSVILLCKLLDTLVLPI